MNRGIIAAAFALALAGCSPQQISDAQRYQADIASVCGVAMTLAPFAPAIAPWIVGACASEERIASLALDPSSLEWVTSLVQKVKG